MEQIYYAPNEHYPSGSEDLQNALKKLAAKVNIQWTTQLGLPESDNAAMLYLCNKLEAHMLSLQLESTYEKLKNVAQQDALSKITNIINEYGQKTERDLIRKPRNHKKWNLIDRFRNRNK